PQHKNETPTPLPLSSSPDISILDSPINYFYLDFSSDANDDIDEDNQRTKIRKGKNSRCKVKYLYDEVENTYLEEEAIKPDPCGCIKSGVQTTFSAPEIS
ncbi:35980_t:CDS:2, partial [Racocetra persica]